MKDKTAGRSLFAGVLLALAISNNANAQTVEELREAAEAGEAKAQFELGRAYDSGDGVLPNISTALDWYRKAADQDHAEAHHYIALTYDYADRVDEDDAEAVRWYIRGAELDWGPSQAELGLKYELGEGVAADPAKARYWYEKAIENDETEAFGYLADLYNRGVGVAQDQAKAIELFSRGAWKGSYYSQVNLAEIYLSKDDSPRDRAQGLAWLLVAGEKAKDDESREQVESALKQANATSDEIKWARRFAVMFQGSLFSEMSEGESDSSLNKTIMTIQKGLMALDFYDGEINGETDDALESAIRAFSSEWLLEEEETSQADLLIQIGAALAFEIMDENTPEGEILSSGSGFYVSPIGHIVTNAHVIDGCDTLRVSGGEKVEIQAVDKESDLALLMAANEHAVTPLPLRAGVGLRTGEPIWTAGFPLSGYVTSEMVFSNGMVMALSGAGQDRREFQISAPTQPGNSGGPILDSSGRVVGVVVSGLDTLGIAAALGDLPENVNFGVSLGTLQSFLDSHTIDYQFVSSVAPLTGPKIAARAEKSTVAILCD